MSEGIYALFGVILGGTISALTTLFVERYKNKNAVNLHVREKREKVYLMLYNQIYKYIDSTDNLEILNDTYNFFLRERAKIQFYSSELVIKKFLDLFNEIVDIVECNVDYEEKIDLIFDCLFSLQEILKKEMIPSDLA
ncbi:MAG: hypothetical protein AAGU14_06930 [Eubacteriaceae bacterium]